MCPGCEEEHHVPTKPHPQGWEFNGDMNSPTLNPSVLITFRRSDPDDADAKVFESTCHAVITNGRVFYCPDSTHKLAGQTVDLPELVARA